MDVLADVKVHTRMASGCKKTGYRLTKNKCIVGKEDTDHFLFSTEIENSNKESVFFYKMGKKVGNEKTIHQKVV